MCKYCNEAPKFQLVEINTGVGITTSPKIPISKCKYMCRYYNEAPKFQLVELNISVGIISLNE
jgi:Tfp pilus assembly major pilin PilA